MRRSMRAFWGAVLAVLLLTAPSVQGRELSQGEKKAISDYIETEAAGEAYPLRLAMAGAILNQLSDPRYPDTVSGVLTLLRYRASGREPKSLMAVESAARGMDITGGATAWAKDKEQVAGTVTLTLFGWMFYKE